MSKTVEVDDFLYEIIAQNAKPFVELKPGDVLARWAKELGLVSKHLVDQVKVTQTEPVRERLISENKARRTRKSPRRIDAFTFLGERRVVDRWWQLFAEVCEILALKHSTKIQNLTKCGIIASSERGMINPRPIASTGLYFESNLSAQVILEKTQEVIRLFGYDSETALKVEEHIASRTGLEYRWR